MSSLWVVSVRSSFLLCSTPTQTVECYRERNGQMEARDGSIPHTHTLLLFYFFSTKSISDFCVCVCTCVRDTKWSLSPFLVLFLYCREEEEEEEKGETYRWPMSMILSPERLTRNCCGNTHRNCCTYSTFLLLLLPLQHFSTLLYREGASRGELCRVFFLSDIIRGPKPSSLFFGAKVNTLKEKKRVNIWKEKQQQQQLRALGLSLSLYTLNCNLFMHIVE